VNAVPSSVHGAKITATAGEESLGSRPMRATATVLMRAKAAIAVPSRMRPQRGNMLCTTAFLARV
jgi:hypothetical protein